MFEVKNTKKQGDIGLGAAISWFVAQGYTVAIPLTDSQDYDLIVEKDDGLKKVQVKTTGRKHKKTHNHIVNLKVCGGNRSGSGKVKKFNPKTVDFLFILTDDNRQFVIPTCSIDVGSELSLCEKYQQHQVGSSVRG